MSSIHLFSCSTNSCLSLMNLVMFCALCHQAVTFFLLNNLNVIQNTNRGYQSKTGAFLYLPKGKFCQLIFCNEETRKPSDTDPSSNLALRMTLFPKKNKNGVLLKADLHCFCISNLLQGADFSHDSMFAAFTKLEYFHLKANQ